MLLWGSCGLFLQRGQRVNLQVFKGGSEQPHPRSSSFPVGRASRKICIRAEEVEAWPDQGPLLPQLSLLPTQLVTAGPRRDCPRSGLAGAGCWFSGLYLHLAFWDPPSLPLFTFVGRGFGVFSEIRL